MDDPGDPLYSDEETRANFTFRPLRDLDVNQVWLLDRHLLWAGYQRERFKSLLPDSTPPGD